MTFALYFAAFLTVSVGLAHSILGERYILTRLFRRGNLPRLFGDDSFTRHTLRFAWHLTTVAWWGFAAVLILMSRDEVTTQNLAWVLAITSLASALITAGLSRGRHLAWIAFMVIAGIAWWVAIG